MKGSRYNNYGFDMIPGFQISLSCPNLCYQIRIKMNDILLWYKSHILNPLCEKRTMQLIQVFFRMVCEKKQCN